MKTTGKWTLLALTPVLAAGLAAGSAFADEGESYGRGFQRYGMRADFARGARGGGWGPMRHLGVMKEALGLTDEQVVKIEDIRTETRKKMIKTRAEIRVARIEMRELMHQEKIDRAAVDKKIQVISNLRTQAMRQGVDTRVKVHAVLTPEQRKKISSLTASGFRGGFGPGGGFGHHGGRGHHGGGFGPGGGFGHHGGGPRGGFGPRGGGPRGF